MRVRDLTGQRFGRLVALTRVGSRGNKALWLCRCDCGIEKLMVGTSLTRGHTKSCGCWRRETGYRLASGNFKHGHTKHGEAPTGTYRSWIAMKSRCLNSDSPNYDLYGGRGIKIHAPWVSSFEIFLADMGERPDGHSLDRIDVYGDYGPDNCRWATPAEQNANRRDSQPPPRELTDRQLESRIQQTRVRLTDLENEQRRRNGVAV